MKWEYKILITVTSPYIVVEREMDALGLAGWELVTAEGHRYTFKRPLVEPVPAALALEACDDCA